MQAETEPVGLSGRLNPEAERLHMVTGCPLPLQVTSEEAELEQSAGEVPSGAGAPGRGGDL